MESIGATDNNAKGGRTAKVNAAGYTLAHVVGIRRGSQRGPNITCDPDGDTRRYQKGKDRQRNTGRRSNELWKEGIGSSRKDE